MAKTALTAKIWLYINHFKLSISAAMGWTLPLQQLDVGHWPPLSRDSSQGYPSRLRDPLPHTRHRYVGKWHFCMRVTFKTYSDFMCLSLYPILILSVVNRVLPSNTSELIKYFTYPGLLIKARLTTRSDLSEQSLILPLWQSVFLILLCHL